MDHAERTSLTEALLAASRALVGISVRTVGEGHAEVTVTQHRLLLLLEACGPLSVNEVAEQLGVNQSNASRHCLRLEKLGLARRDRASHDGRAVQVSLTESGQAHVDAVRAARRREIQAVLERMDVPDSRVAVAALEAFALAVRDPTVFSATHL